MTADAPGFRLLGERRCSLGEGPVYDRHADTLWWFDILDRKLCEYRFADDVFHVHDLPFMASALARIDDRRQLIVAENGLHVRDIATGALSLHRPLEAENTATRSNDSRVHPSGAFWIGTMGKKAEHAAGAIYWYRDGEIKRLYDQISIPNAICFSPDGRIGYFTDTLTAQILSVTLDPETGLPVGQPMPFGAKSANGDPDGAIIDAKGNLWVARWGGHGIEMMSPAGDVKRTIKLPAVQISCPAFVGPKAGVIAVTSARAGLKDDATPEDGATFLLDISVDGRFEPDVDFRA